MIKSGGVVMPFNMALTGGEVIIISLLVITLIMVLRK